MSEKLLEVVNFMLDNKGLAKVEGLSPNTRLREDLAFDSLDLAEFTVRLEKEFGVDVFSDGLVSTMEEVMAKLNTNGK